MKQKRNIGIAPAQLSDAEHRTLFPAWPCLHNRDIAIDLTLRHRPAQGSRLL